MVIWNKELIYPNALKAPYKTFLTWRLFKEHFNTHKFSRHITKYCSLVSIRVVVYSSNRKEHMMIYLHGVHGVGVHGFTLWGKIITNEYLKSIIVYRNWELFGAWKKKTITFGRSLMTSFLFKEMEQSIYMLNDKAYSSTSLHFSRKNTERKKINI